MGSVRELPVGNALKQAHAREEMDTKIDRWPNPGDLLHAALEGWVVAEISDATLAKMQPVPLIESRRSQGIKSSRVSRASVSARLRTSR
jgi:hypothetical protein